MASEYYLAAEIMSYLLLLVFLFVCLFVQLLLSGFLFVSFFFCFMSLYLIVLC